MTGRLYYPCTHLGRLAGTCTPLGVVQYSPVQSPYSQNCSAFLVSVLSVAETSSVGTCRVIAEDNHLIKAGGCAAGVATWCCGAGSALSTPSSCCSGSSSPRPGCRSWWRNTSTSRPPGTSSPWSPTPYWRRDCWPSLSHSWDVVGRWYPASVSLSLSSSLLSVSSLLKLRWGSLCISR